MAAGKHAVNAVARMVPKREPDFGPRSVVFAEGVRIQRSVFLCGPFEQVNFFLIKKAAGDDKAVFVIGGDLLGS